MASTKVIPSNKLRLLITSRCNARCPYCHNEGQPLKLAERITPEYTRNLLQLQDFQEVTISGGEPLIVKRLPQVVKTLKDEGKHVTIITNGSLPKRLQQVLDVAHVDELHIGCDTLDADQYNAIKQIHLNDMFETIKVCDDYNDSHDQKIDLKLNVPLGDLFANSPDAVRDQRMKGATEEMEDWIEFLEKRHAEGKSPLVPRFIEILGEEKKPLVPLPDMHAKLEKMGFHEVSKRGWGKVLWSNGRVSFETLRCLCAEAHLYGHNGELCYENQNAYIHANGNLAPCMLNGRTIDIYDDVNSGNIEAARAKIHNAIKNQLTEYCKINLQKTGQTDKIVEQQLVPKRSSKGGRGIKIEKSAPKEKRPL